MKVLLTALNSKYIHTNLSVRYLHEFRRNLSPVSGCFDAFLLHLEH